MTRKQFAVIATRLKEELENIKSLHQELSAKGLLGPKKKIKRIILSQRPELIDAHAGQIKEAREKYKREEVPRGTVDDFISEIAE